MARKYCTNCGEGDHETKDCPEPKLDAMELGEAQKLAKASIEKLRTYGDPKASKQATMIERLLKETEDNSVDALGGQLVKAEGNVKRLAEAVDVFVDACERRRISHPDPDLDPGLCVIKMKGGPTVEHGDPDLAELTEVAEEVLDQLPDEAKDDPKP